MNDLYEITKFPAGPITMPPSKAVLHRAVICSALAGGNDFPAGVSEDIDATVACVRALMNARGDEPVTLDCGESGSTLRFLLPVAPALGIPANFTGRRRRLERPLLERPLGPYLGALSRHGAEITRINGAILARGRLSPGVYELPGDVSSQYVTGLLLALPLLAADSEIVLTSPLESRSYVDITLDIMHKYGVTARETPRGYAVPGGQRYANREISAEGDFSQAAFFLAASALGRECEVLGLDTRSKQGDRAILDILTNAGANVIFTERGGVIARGRELRGIDFDASDIPDLVPPVAALLSFAEGESRVYNAERLRHKESDRLAAVSEELNNLGADITVSGGELRIRGKPELRGGTVDPRGDHRIAMMAAVAAARCREPVFVRNHGCVAKSYPGFWKDFEVI